MTTEAAKLRMNLHEPRAVVCGAGGFIGGHLVKDLLARGVRVIRAVDIKPLEDWYQIAEGVENIVLDLKEKDNCLIATHGAEHVYQLAADMGGMGFIENNKTLCMLNVLTSTNMLVAAREAKVKRFFTRLRPVSTMLRGRPGPMQSHLRNPMPIRPYRKMAMAGRNCSVNGCAVISKKISD